MPRYWEDYEIGEKFTTGKRTVSQGIIDTITGLSGYIAPFFWDEEFSKEKGFSGRIAPGHVTILLMGGLGQQSSMFDAETLMGLIGLDNIKFKTPLQDGDTIRVETWVSERRETKRPGVGVIINKCVCKNQRDEEVAEMDEVRLIKRRA